MDNQKPQRNVQSGLILNDLPNNDSLGDLKPLLTKKDIQKFMFNRFDQKHWEKIMNAKAEVDMEPVELKVKNSVRKKKPNLIDEVKKTEIERENRILLEKITNIIRNKRYKPCDASNNFTVQEIKEKQGNDYFPSSKKSLNITKRWDEFKRIKVENKRILSRLMNQKSHFDWNQLDKSNRQHEELVDSMCQFPRISQITSSLNQSKKFQHFSPSKKHDTITSNIWNKSRNSRTKLNNSNQSQQDTSYQSQIDKTERIAQNPYFSIQNTYNGQISTEGSQEFTSVKLLDMSHNIQQTQILITEDSMQKQEETEKSLEEKIKKFKMHNLAASPQTLYARSKSTQHRKITPLRNLNYLCTAANITNKKKIMYQTQKVLGFRPYQVEIATTKNKVLIECVDNETLQLQTIQLFKKQANRIIEQLRQARPHMNLKKKEKYKELIKLLDFKFGKIIFDVPKDLLFYNE